MRQNSGARSRAGKIIDAYLAKPDATIEIDIFEPFVKEIEAAEQRGRIAGLEAAGR